jgi:gamma-glutamylputrescine oxidase
MNLLFANDARGAYPDSWYAATVDLLAPFAPLHGTTRADVCIIGAGYTGLSAALHLAEAGLSVVVLEAQRVGFGASGRNGGQLGSGQRLDQMRLEADLGRDTARALWDLGQDAKALVRNLVQRHAIPCHLRDGVAWAARTDATVRDLHVYAEHMDRHYGYAIEPLGREAFAALCPSPDYRGGLLDMGAGHLHPLALCLGLARAATTAGAVIHEATEALQIDSRDGITVTTAQGHVRADHLILACNGYLGGLAPAVAARVMPINSYVGVTEPLGPEAARVLTRDVAVTDDRFVNNYFRLTHDGRLLFGGGETYRYRYPADPRVKVRPAMLKVFPHLHDIRLDHAWGGTLAITMRRLPYLARLGPRVLSASGYSGHGLGNAVQAGRLMAEAVRGQGAGFDTFAALPSTPFPGGARLRSPLLVLAMTWYALRDRLGL